jgi:hypothetical protein
LGGGERLARSLLFKSGFHFDDLNHGQTQPWVVERPEKSAAVFPPRLVSTAAARKMLLEQLQSQLQLVLQQGGTRGGSITDQSAKPTMS